MAVVIDEVVGVIEPDETRQVEQTEQAGAPSEAREAALSLAKHVHAVLSQRARRLHAD